MVGNLLRRHPRSLAVSAALILPFSSAAVVAPDAAHGHPAQALRPVHATSPSAPADSGRAASKIGPLAGAQANRRIVVVAPVRDRVRETSGLSSLDIPLVALQAYRTAA